MAKTWHALSFCQATTPSDFKAGVRQADACIAGTMIVPSPTNFRAVSTMRFEYELIVICGIIALGFVHLIDMWLRSRKNRDILRARAKDGSAEKESRDAAQPGIDIHRPVQGARNGERFHRFVMALLILALIWCSILVWVET